MPSKKIQYMIDLLEEASVKRLSIDNNHNGKHKIGCIIFDHKLNKQCVLRVWLQPV
jgi:hypothetical protein